MRVLVPAVIAMLVAIARFAIVPTPSGLEVWAPVGDFKLVERSGAAFDPAVLRGRPWIAGFVFTYCSGPCPVVTTKMAQLQASLPKDMRFVTFTVDPERDTPDKLRAYAEGYGAEAGRWFFLTGTTTEIDRVVRDRFRLAATKDPGTATEYQVTHSTRLVLIDRAGRMRGSYIGIDDEDVERLGEDAKRLIRSGE